jgi:hypothetical protein
MTDINTKPKPHLPAKLAATLAVSALLALGTFVQPTSAAPRHFVHRGYDHRHFAYRGSWNGGYYGAPPVVYGAPYSYYNPPPVVYGPGIGINLPGVSIGIR